MRKTFIIAALSLCCLSMMAQNNKEDEGFTFTTVKENPITPIKNQYRSSTCWSFSGIGFLESELLRMNKGEYDLSEMFVVHHCMIDRAENYVRYHGDASFAPGGSFYDVLYVMSHYGLVPQEAMPGIMYGDSLHNHGELDAVAGAYMNAIAKGNSTKLSPVWKKGLEAIYDSYLGKCPEKFNYKGKEYTPMSFVKSLGLNADDYVNITSFTHHPFYTKFAIEVQDNWRNGQAWNVPLDEFMQIIDNALNNGYTVAWGADVSEQGFTRDGVAVMPDAVKAVQAVGSDMARWTGMTAESKRKELTSRPLPEMTVTQEMRQQAFDNWETTDDHGMLLYGIAKDQNGKEYYMVKNSWGLSGKYKGTWYASKAFVAYKTLNFVINKKALPKDIAKKLGIKL